MASKQIEIFIEYNTKMRAVADDPNMLLGDLLEQMADKGQLPAGQNWIVVKEGSDEQLALGKSLAALGIQTGDTLFLGLPNKGGC